MRETPLGVRTLVVILFYRVMNNYSESLGTYVCTYVRTYVCMYVCTYVCMYVRTYVLRTRLYIESWIIHATCSFFIEDLFHGVEITKIRLAGLDHVISFTEHEGRIYLRVYQ